MIGSREESTHEVKKDFFIPLIDGSLIRFDQDEVNGIGYLEKTAFNMRDARFVDAISKDQCIVTGNSKTTAIQIDLLSGEILQVVGGDDDSIKVRKASEEQEGDNRVREPFWMRLKKYEYLSYDHLQGITQWRIFYSEFSHHNSAKPQSTTLMPSNNPDQQLESQQLFVRGNIIYSIAADDEAKPYQKWNMVSETPAVARLRIKSSDYTRSRLDTFHKSRVVSGTDRAYKRTARQEK
ncbi:hypothetical protein FGO68_gene10976 [Halteria grandinella]|uniref:Uncharacterized protein n=1 Tax=Halteria grandinella TaxID=5974 RepID=A0A8J8NA87_HALGN|nr:hypothetical protein FGO68_gene10976 [Halteria grandinella]